MDMQIYLQYHIVMLLHLLINRLMEKVKTETDFKSFELKAWQNPNCQIIETSTGKILKDYGTTISRT